MIKPISGNWWLDDGKDSGVWPCQVLSANLFGVQVQPTLGPNSGEQITVSNNLTTVYTTRPSTGSVML